MIAALELASWLSVVFINPLHLCMSTFWHQTNITVKKQLLISLGRKMTSQTSFTFNPSLSNLPNLGSSYILSYTRALKEIRFPGQFCQKDPNGCYSASSPFIIAASLIKEAHEPRRQMQTHTHTASYSLFVVVTRVYPCYNSLMLLQMTASNFFCTIDATFLYMNPDVFKTTTSQTCSMTLFYACKKS